MKEIVLPKIVAIGIYNAQIALKNRTISKNRKTTMFEIELPIDNGGISYIDDESHPINENTVICAKPGQMRHTRLPFKCYYIHMIIKDGQLMDKLTTLPNFIELSNINQIKEIFTLLNKHYNTALENDDILLQSLILKLIYILNESSSSFVKSISKNNNHKIIESTIEYINCNLSADLSLEKLAIAANFNSIYFHKLFKASTGKTLHDYIEEQRIKKSVGLLTSTDMTLAEIAYECGFSSQSYFSYAFKRRMKLSPREYAKFILSKYEKIP